VQVDFEQAGIVLRRARNDRFRAREIVAEPLVVAVVAGIGLTRDGRGADVAAKQRQGAVDARIRPGDAGDADRDRLDPPEVVAGTVHVEQGFGNPECAATAHAQLEKR
jgi:hypothetical protein